LAQSEPKLRVAASTYLNTAPLIWSFSRGPRRHEIDLIDAVPARCAELLQDQAVDAALVPVIEYQRISDISLVPGVCVASHRRVRSVVLATRAKNLRRVQRVALDQSSRTSAALVRIIFREFLDFEPEWISTPPDLSAMLRAADAALVIGDPAMTFRREGLQVFDLAALWREHTGFGFVFAMWMARNLSAERVAQIDFAAARDEGLTAVEEIATDYERSLSLERHEIRDYLRQNIAYHLDEELQRGLALYFDLALKHHLIPEVKPLEFIAPVPV
jgi:chorismate dehydratase